MLNIIVNQTSGIHRGEKALKKVSAYLSEQGIDYVVHSTEKAGDAERLAAELTKDKAETVKIVIIGGDGTFHEVVNGVESFENVLIGFVPGGRGNDFARAAGLSKNPIEAIKRILSGTERRIDILETAGRKSLNVGGTGLDIEVLERVIAKGSNGKLNYIFALMACLRDFEPYKIKVTLDSGEVLEREVILVTTCNGSCFGGGIRISPLSKVDDGLMDVVIINMVKHSRIPFIFASFLRGKHIVPKLAHYAEHYRCTSAEIVNASSNKIQLDGEIYENREYTARILPAALRVIGLLR